MNSSNSELKYRTSRNTAVLLASDHNPEKVFKDIKSLYDKRSKLVHTGEKACINTDDLYLLRFYVRESIKKAMVLNMDKDKLMDLLNKCGFENGIESIY